MKFSDYSKKVATLKMYIEKKWATTPKELSNKLQVSERTILRMIAHLKEDGCNIEYCKKEKIYKILL